MIGVAVDVNTKDALQGLERLKQRTVQAQRNAMTEIKNGVLQDYRRTSATWHRKVEFRAYESGTPERMTVKVTTDDLIYKFVDVGTRPHIIAPKEPGGRLAFRWGGHGSYRAKTSPGYLASRNGGPTGPYVYRRFVRHPGTQARKFTPLIFELWSRKARGVLDKHVKLQLARTL